MNAFQFFCDEENKVLLARFDTTLNERSIVDLCDDLAQYVAVHGRCRGILDLSNVVDVDVTTDFLIKKSRINPLHGQHRVLVAPTDRLYGLIRMFQVYQGIETGDEPMVARTFEEACAMLDLASPNFRPVEIRPEAPS